MTNRKQILNVGVVGLGRMGNRHASNFLRLVPRARLVAVCSPAQHERTWAEETLAPHGVQVLSAFEDLIEVEGLDAIVIASSTVLHVTQTIAALNKGIHVLCEKPIASSASELTRVYDRLSDPTRTATLMVAFMRRFDEDYQEAYRKVKAGDIGRVTVYRSHQAEAVDREDASYYEYLRTCGGIFIDSVIHDIDLSLMFLGEDSQPKSVTAIGTAQVFTELAATGDADNAIGVCEFWGGKMAHFYLSRTARHGYDNETQIWGLEGKININSIPRKNRIETCDKDGVKIDAIPSWYERYVPAFVNEATQWVDAILEGKPMPVPLGSSLKSMLIAEALQESLRTGEKIKFDQNGNRISAAIPNL